MAETSTKRARGSYSKLICLGCRSRKIKCALPDDVRVQPMGRAQPVDKACERCKQKGLDCIVDYATLGRPASKRRRPENAVPEEPNSTNSTDRRGVRAASGSASPDVESYFLSHPEDNNASPAFNNRQRSRPSIAEICETLTSPVRLLSTLLSRDRNFTMSVPTTFPPPQRLSILELVDSQLSSLFDQHLIWHKFYFPWIPSLSSLRHDISASDENGGLSAVTLFATLCCVALDVPADVLAPHRRIQPALRNIVFHHGQKMLFGLPKHRHTIIALEMIAEYLPLALVATRETAAFALRGQLYLTLTKHMALQLGLNDAVQRLRVQLEDPGISDVGQLVLDSMQWANLSMAEIELDGYSRLQRDPTQQSTPSLDESLEVLQLAASMGRIPAKAYFMYHRLAVFADETSLLRTAGTNWRNLEKLAEVIQQSESRSQTLRADVARARRELFSAGAELSADESSALAQLSDAAIHARHINVVGASLFYAVMAASVPSPSPPAAATTTASGSSGSSSNNAPTAPAATPSSNHPTTTNTDDHNDNDVIRPTDAVQISTQIIATLTAWRTPPYPHHRAPTRAFLEDHGRTRMDDLERAMTDFIALCDECRLRVPIPSTSTSTSVPWHPPARRTAAKLLFVAKDVVENNAARLKGWGALHERCGTQVVLLGECARRLEALEGGAGSGVCVGGARLVRSLGRIVADWRRGFLEREGRQEEKASGEGGSGGAGAGEGMRGGGGDEAGGMGVGAEGEEWVPGELFADWGDWPQIDSYDWSQLFTEGFGFE